MARVVMGRIKVARVAGEDGPNINFIGIGINRSRRIVSESGDVVVMSSAYESW